MPEVFLFLLTTDTRKVRILVGTFKGTAHKAVYFINLNHCSNLVAYIYLPIYERFVNNDRH